MTDIWEDPVDAIHGKAVLFTAWRKDGPSWKRVGTFFSRAAAEAALA